MTERGQLLSFGDIDRQVVDLVIWARRRYGLAERCTGGEACGALGLRVVFADLPPGRDGMLRPDGTVAVSLDVRVSRREYTIFHEVMHRLIEEEADFYERLADGFADDQPSLDAAIERCCQLGAAEFLMPAERVRTMIAEEGFSLKLIECLITLNGASVSAAAKQLAACAPVDCYVVVCRYAAVPRWPHGVDLFVEHAARHGGANYPIAHGTVIPQDHLLRRVWESKEFQSGPTSVPFRSGKTFPCEHGEARMVGGQVVGILYMAHPPRKGQLTMGLTMG